MRDNNSHNPLYYRWWIRSLSVVVLFLPHEKYNIAVAITSKQGRSNSLNRLAPHPWFSFVQTTTPRLLSTFYALLIRLWSSNGLIACLCSYSLNFLGDYVSLRNRSVHSSVVTNGECIFELRLWLYHNLATKSCKWSPRLSITSSISFKSLALYACLI